MQLARTSNPRPFGRALVCAMCLALIAEAAAARTISVGPGTPYGTLTAALAAAQPGDTLALAPGDFAAFNGEQFPLELRHPLTLVSADPDNPARIVGDGTHTILSIRSASGPVILEHLILTSGGGLGAMLPRRMAQGGAIQLADSNLILRNCELRSNTVQGNLNGPGQGGAISARNARLEIVDSRIVGNTADEGGGLFLHQTAARLDGVIFHNNEGLAGSGGIAASDSTVTLNRVIVTANSGTSTGGALFADTTVTATECVFVGNVGNTKAGGVTLDDASVLLQGCLFEANDGASGALLTMDGDALVESSLFRNNSAFSDGVFINGTTEATLRNCLLHGHSSTRTLRVGPGATLMLEHATVVAPDAKVGLAVEGSATVRNSILWGGTASLARYGRGQPTVSHSIVQGGWPGQGVLSADPQFAMPEHGNYRLAAASPGIDAGQPLPEILKDLDANLRMVGPAADLGAFEIANGRRIRSVGRNSSADYPTLSMAMAWADNDDIIVVRPDTYGESTGEAFPLDLMPNTSITSEVPGELPVLHSNGTGPMLRANGIKHTSSLIESIAFVGGPALELSQGNLVVRQCRLNGEGATATGIVLASGNVKLLSSTVENFSNGGVVATDSALTVIDVEFIGNTRSTDGGAMALYGTQAELSQVTFEGNRSIGHGGAVYAANAVLVELREGEFRHNSSGERGGAVYFSGQSLDAEELAFFGNASETDGGAVWFDGSALAIERSQFESNSAEEAAGALAIGASAQSLLVDRCAFTGNTSLHGGALQTDPLAGLITNSSFWQNGPWGMVVNNEVGETIEVRHCAWFENGDFATDNGGGVIGNGLLSVVNSISWGNVANVDSIGAPPTVAASIIGGDFPGQGILSLNPQWVGPEDGDFHLQPNSPAIDAGIPSNFPLFDMDGEPRSAGLSVDIGPDEFNPQYSPVPSPTPTATASPTPSPTPSPTAPTTPTPAPSCDVPLHSGTVTVSGPGSYSIGTGADHEFTLLVQQFDAPGPVAIELAVDPCALEPVRGNPLVAPLRWEVVLPGQVTRFEAEALLRLAPGDFIPPPGLTVAALDGVNGWEVEAIQLGQSGQFARVPLTLEPGASGLRLRPGANAWSIGIASGFGASVPALGGFGALILAFLSSVLLWSRKENYDRRHG